jgi:hypothetical protein
MNHFIDKIFFYSDHLRVFPSERLSREYFCIVVVLMILEDCQKNLEDFTFVFFENEAATV